MLNVYTAFPSIVAPTIICYDKSKMKTQLQTSRHSKLLQIYSIFCQKVVCLCYIMYLQNVRFSRSQPGHSSTLSHKMGYYINFFECANLHTKASVVGHADRVHNIFCVESVDSIIRVWRSLRCMFYTISKQCSTALV